MLGFLGRIAGPKVLLGVVITGAVGMGILFWLYVSASESAAQAEQQNASLRQSLQSERQAVEKLQAERNRLQDALQTARTEARAARERADRTRTSLEELEESDEQVREWAADSLPGPVADRLLDYAGTGDTDESGDDQASE